MNLDKFFNPKSIAIIGASSEEGKVGNSIAKNVLELGFSGKTFLINPKKGKILGQDCYGSMAEISEEIDLAIVAIPAKFVNETIQAAKDKVKNFVVVSAGFSEIGAEGKLREAELQKIASENELNILGPNCLGFILPHQKLNASFGPGMPKAGNVCFISQSGALLVATADILQKEKVGLSGLISIGNKMQLDEIELLDYFVKDEKTKVIGMYLEGIKNGEKFFHSAKAAARKKPIVILKAGKTEKSQLAISSHTGALAGSAEIMSEALRAAGIIEAQNLEEFVNFLQFFSLANFSQEKNIVAITNAGGAGVLTADAFWGKKINLAEISEEIKASLRKNLPVESSVSNPIDLLGDAQEDRYAKTLEEIKKQEDLGVAVVILTPQAQTPVEKIAEVLIDFAKNNPKIQMLTVFIGGERVATAVENFKQNEILTFAFPEQAILALEKYFLWKTWQDVPDFKNDAEAFDEKRAQSAKEIILTAKNQGRTALLFAEASELMQEYGINTVKFWEADMQEKIDFPVVVKIDSDKVLHKTDKKGLVLGIKDEKELSQEVALMQKNFPGENIIIQPMLPRQMEIIVGIKKDVTFGAIIAYGLGGIYTEVFKTVDFLIEPSGVEEIKAAILKGKLNFLFTETRGQKPYAVEEFAEILWKIWLLAKEAPAIKEFDINPLLVYNNNQKSVAVDVKIII